MGMLRSGAAADAAPAAADRLKRRSAMRFLKKLLGLERNTPRPASEQDRFATLVLEALRHADPAIELEYRPELFEFVHPEGQKTFLANSYLEYCRLPEGERPMHVHRMAAFIIDSRKPLPTGEEALDACCRYCARAPT
jgi:hypothetical protein